MNNLIWYRISKFLYINLMEILKVIHITNALSALRKLSSTSSRALSSPAPWRIENLDLSTPSYGPCKSPSPSRRVRLTQSSLEVCLPFVLLHLTGFFSPHPQTIVILVLGYFFIAGSWLFFSTIMASLWGLSASWLAMWNNSHESSLCLTFLHLKQICFKLSYWILQTLPSNLNFEHWRTWQYNRHDQYL